MPQTDGGRTTYDGRQTNFDFMSSADIVKQSLKWEIVFTAWLHTCSRSYTPTANTTTDGFPEESTATSDKSTTHGIHEEPTATADLVTTGGFPEEPTVSTNDFADDATTDGFPVQSTRATGDQTTGPLSDGTLVEITVSNDERTLKLSTGK